MFPISCKVEFSVLFSFFFFFFFFFALFKAEKTAIKINITPYGENLNMIRFGIWRVTFLKSFFLFLPLENIGMDLRFQCSGRFTTCELGCDTVYCLSTYVDKQKYPCTSDRERNRTFSQICRSLQKMNQQKSNLAHIEKRYCCYFAENLMRKF